MRPASPVSRPLYSVARRASSAVSAMARSYSDGEIPAPGLRRRSSLMALSMRLPRAPVSPRDDEAAPKAVVWLMLDTVTPGLPMVLRLAVHSSGCIDG